ncbi:MAG: hypothetical protein JWO50_734 [Candidatus Kaiserbacteria bacterium]|nr:hypothetical protein [Candidatus Kaiserbacteria bacterium]
MTWWNLGGLNPSFKEFVEKYPNKTLIGMMWAMYWRLIIVAILVEIAVFVVIFAIAFAFSVGH